MTEQIKLEIPEAGFCDISDILRETAAASGLTGGICLVRAAEPGVGVLHGPKGADAMRDLWDDYARLFDGSFGSEVKASIGGQALELLIIDGTLLLGPEETVYAAGYGKKESVKLLATCIG